MPNKAKTAPKSGKSLPRTKSEKIIHLLERSSGATIGELQQATGWQAHSVRGFLSGTLKKRMALPVSSEKTKNGKRRYRIDKHVKA
jgi:hypothetical protein